MEDNFTRQLPSTTFASNVQLRLIEPPTRHRLTRSRGLLSIVCAPSSLLDVVLARVFDAQQYERAVAVVGTHVEQTSVCQRTRQPVVVCAAAVPRVAVRRGYPLAAHVGAVPRHLHRPDNTTHTPSQAAVTGRRRRPPSQSAIIGRRHRQPSQAAVTGNQHRPSSQAAVTGHRHRQPSQAAVTGHRHRQPSQTAITGSQHRPPSQAANTGHHHRPPSQAAACRYTSIRAGSNGIDIDVHHTISD